MSRVIGLSGHRGSRKTSALQKMVEKKPSTGIFKEGASSMFRGYKESDAWAIYNEFGPESSESMQMGRWSAIEYLATSVIKPEVIVTDRTPLDTLVFWRIIRPDSSSVRDPLFESVAMHFIRFYEKIFIVESAAKRFAGDEVAEKEVELFRQIYSRFGLEDKVTFLRMDESDEICDAILDYVRGEDRSESDIPR